MLICLSQNFVYLRIRRLPFYICYFVLWSLKWVLIYMFWPLLIIWFINLNFFSSIHKGILLLEEIINTYGQEGIDSILEASQARFHESCKAKVSGHSDWWKVSFLNSSMQICYKLWLYGAL